MHIAIIFASPQGGLFALALLALMTLSAGCGPDASASQPTSTVLPLPTPERVQRPYLGVGYVMVTPDPRNSRPGGAWVGPVVPGGPAAEVGMRNGDVIVRADGREIARDWNLDDAVYAHQPGDEITLTYWRDDQTFEVVVMLDAAREITFKLDPLHQLKRLGVSFLAVSNGLVVAEVVSESPAHEAGLAVGDLVVALNDEVQLSGEALLDLLREAGPGEAITLMVEHDKARREVTLVIEEDRSH